jgi:glutathione peroxidase
MSIYDLSFMNNHWEEVNLSSFKDKVMLLVNVASNCGFTKQYRGLELLNKTYKDRGLVVIGFPCNQFGEQEPGTDSEIEEFCKTNYDVTFTLSTKIDVNGEQAHPIYKYLTGKTGHDISWNFQKFLIQNGEIVAQGGPDLPPMSLEDQIKSILK